MIVFIESYAHCKKLGIKPCDSIINTVIDTEKPRTILTHTEGQTHLMKDEITFDTPKCFIFDNLNDEDAEPIEIHAKTLLCAKLALKNNHEGNFVIHEKIVKFIDQGWINTDA